MWRYVPPGVNIKYSMNALTDMATDFVLTIIDTIENHKDACILLLQRLTTNLEINVEIIL